MDSESLDNVQRPSVFLWLTEMFRAIIEGFEYHFKKKKLYKKEQNTGDGHPVLVLPGFLASDTSTHTLRVFLNDIGYQAQGWGMGRNLGQPDSWEKIVALLTKIHQETGQEVTIIGWSLGGVFGRHAARQHPEMVRQVITLGSPFAGLMKPNNASWVYKMISGEVDLNTIPADVLAEKPNPLNVPSTAIYSKNDGIVSWKVCVERDLNEYCQNVEVKGSHLGLGVNFAVLKVIADRLKYKESNWVKFKPNNPAKAQRFYPSY